MLIDNIGTLVTNDPELGTISGAALVFEDGIVQWAGLKGSVPEGAGTERFDAGGRAVIPGFVDSHGHLVFAGDRAEEFAARMAGTAYSAGGIKTTVKATREASDEQLGANLDRLVNEALRSGTTTVETKSGYGLTVPDERRSLEVATPRTPETTFLGAHVVAPEYKDRAGRATWTWSRARCSTPARRTRAGSTCSARRAPSTATRRARSCRPASPRA